MIADVGEYQTRIGIIIFGYLAVQKAAPDMVYDDATHSLVSSDVRERVEAKVMFFVWPEAHLIVAEKVAGIQPSAFRTRFRQVVHNAPELPMATIELEPVAEEGGFMAEVMRLESVEQAKFRLRPSNPRYTDKWKPQSDDMKKARAIELRKLYKPRANESLAVEGTIIEDDVAQVEDGFGIGRVIGRRDGSRVFVSSKKEQESISATIDVAAIEETLDDLVSELNKVDSRFKDAKRADQPD